MYRCHGYPTRRIPVGRLRAASALEAVQGLGEEAKIEGQHRERQNQWCY